MNYAGFDDDAWKNFCYNLSARKSIKLMKLFFPKEIAKILGVSYAALRLVDDGVDLPWDGQGEDPRRVFLSTIENMFMEMEPGYYKEAAEIMAAEDPLELLIPKDENEITAETTEKLIKTFYHNYRHLDAGNRSFLKDELKIFFEGMHKDLDTEGGLFSQEGLDDYFDAIQTEPLVIGMLAVSDPKKDLAEGVTYEKFYDSLQSVSRGIMNIKNVRGKELVEDTKMNRIYFSAEELAEAGLNREEFLDIVDKQGTDGNLKEMITKRVHTANAYFNKSAETIMKLPDDEVYSGLKKYMVAYGLLAKRWAKNLAKNGYNTFNDGKCLDIEPGTVYKLYMFMNAKKVGNGNYKKVLNKVLDWKFLNPNILKKEMREVSYRIPTGE